VALMLVKVELVVFELIMTTQEVVEEL